MVLKGGASTTVRQVKSDQTSDPLVQNGRSL